MKTKTLQNAKNVSNDSKDIHFIGDIDTSLVLGNANFGDVDISKISNDNDLFNIDDIILDISSLTFGTVGEIKILSEDIDPSGFAQVDTWELDKESNLNFVIHEDTHVNVLGKRVEVIKGTSITAMTTIIFKVIDEYVKEGKYFNSVKQLDDYTLEVEYADRRKHDMTNNIIYIENNFIDINISVIREVIYGYGKWLKLGMESKTIGATKVELFYYKRVL